MNVYISSTYKDLIVYREGVATALRQIGHKVIHMEGYTAEESRPLDKCVKDAASADLYIGIFAWRYGYIPEANPSYTDLPPEVIPGIMSITEAEYHAAENIPRLIFILADSVKWLPALMDAHTEYDHGEKIRDLRKRLGEAHTVSFFTSPDQLVSQVIAAVRRQELSAQLELKSLQEVDAHSWMMNPESQTPHGLYDTTMMAITDHIRALDEETYMIIDIGNGRNWWSTRLYFLASLLVDLSDVHFLVFVDMEKRFFGASNALAVRDIIGRRIGAIRLYEEALAAVNPLPDLTNELNRRGNEWETEMRRQGGEESVKTWVRKQELKRFLGASLIQRAVNWSPDEKSNASGILEVVDQILKWPHDMVPLVKDQKFYKVVERIALTEEVAKIYVSERLKTSV